MRTAALVAVCVFQPARAVRWYWNENLKRPQLEIPKNQMEAHALRLKERAKAKADLNDKLLRHNIA